MKYYGFICLFIFQQLIAGTLSTGRYPYYSRLLDDLFKGYNKEVMPARNDASPVNSTLGMTLLNFDPEKNARELFSNVWLEQKWNDFRLQWAPDEYDGITQVIVDYGRVWTPDLTLYNSAVPLDMIPPSTERNLAIYNTGKVLFVRHVALRSTCDVRRQSSCVLKMGSWGYSASRLDVYNRDNKIDLSFFTSNPDWEITNTTVKRHVKHYECCPEPYVDITFEIQLKKV